VEFGAEGFFKKKLVPNVFPIAPHFYPKVDISCIYIYYKGCPKGKAPLCFYILGEFSMFSKIRMGQSKWLL
jgi:hypothetical protein